MKEGTSPKKPGRPGGPGLRAWLWSLLLPGLLLLMTLACGGERALPSPPPPLSSPTPFPLPPPTSPSIPSPTPPPTPTPIPLSLAAGVPIPLQQAATALIEAYPNRYRPAGDREGGGVQIQIAPPTPAGPTIEWVYALVAPFPTIPDGVAWADVEAAWDGTLTEGPFAHRPLLMSPATEAALAQAVFGRPPGPDAVLALPAEQLLDRAWAERPAWAIVPFEALEPRWKVLRVDGRSPLDRGLDTRQYPLVVRLGVTASDPELAARFLADATLPLTNRDESQMTVLLMTGVTALVRATAWKMEQKGILYPAQDIGDWLRSADITHISNEIPFAEDCPFPNPVQEDLVFCSDPRYIELLESIGTDIVELTGNHFADYGAEATLLTVAMYEERGWPYYGGGRNLAEAQRPVTITHNGNTFGFLGCNPVGPAFAWATEEQPGAAPCDFDLMHAQIRQLRAQGVLPIVTWQYWEFYDYAPTPQQQADFRGMAEAGAVIVSGSQAHHPQAIEFYRGAFIHYGLGNLFFDQMDELETRQEILDRHVFYAGRHISTELLTAMLEEYARPRPMTEEERRQLLEALFAASGW